MTATIFSDKNILNTTALLRLAAVASPNIGTYQQHFSMLKFRIASLYTKAEWATSKGEVCQTIVEFLGSEGLTECGSMGGIEIAENILSTSPGAALLADLRERWEAVVKIKKSEPQNTDFYADLNLQEWLEALVAEYIDI